jgi:hypothetical protein
MNGPLCSLRLALALVPIYMTWRHQAEWIAHRLISLVMQQIITHLRLEPSESARRMHFSAFIDEKGSEVHDLVDALASAVEPDNEGLDRCMPRCMESSRVLSSTHHRLLHCFLNCGVGCIILEVSNQVLYYSMESTARLPNLPGAGATAPASTRRQDAVLKTTPLNFTLD